MLLPKTKSKIMFYKLTDHQLFHVVLISIPIESETKISIKATE